MFVAEASVSQESIDLMEMDYESNSDLEVKNEVDKSFIDGTGD